MKIQRAPLVTFVVVNWNGKNFLGRCLAAIKSQTFQDFQIIIVDNASTDGSVDNLSKEYPNIQLIKMESNTGFAFANNAGAKEADGEWLALVNNDAFLTPEWLEKMVNAARQHPQYSSFASRLMRTSEEEIVEATGDVCHISCHAWHRDFNQPHANVNREIGDVFSASAAAAFYNKERFLEVGGFDDRYFSHHEDVDLGFRLQLRGYRCLYVPGAEVIHIGSASFGVESDKTVYQVHRNVVWTYFKDMPTRLLWKYLLAHLFGNLVFLIHYSLRGQWKIIWRAKYDALMGLPSTIRERRLIHNFNQVDTSEIVSLLDHSWFGPYTLGNRSKSIRRLSRFLGIIS